MPKFKSTLHQTTIEASTSSSAQSFAVKGLSVCRNDFRFVCGVRLEIQMGVWPGGIGGYRGRNSFSVKVLASSNPVNRIGSEDNSRELLDET